MASSPMIVQAKGQPAVIVPTTTQTPKAIIPAEIRNESTISMIGPLFFRAQTIDGVEFEYIYLDRHVARDSVSTSIEIPILSGFQTGETPRMGMRNHRNWRLEI